MSEIEPRADITLFDVAAAEEAKTEAMGRVDEHAPADWKAAADAAILECACSVPAFTTDRVWWLLGMRGVAGPHEPKAMGPRMRAAAFAGYIVKTDHTRTSRSATNHKRPLAVWRSLIFEQDAGGAPVRREE